MYTATLLLHSLLRWAVVGLLLWALADAARGASGSRPWGPKGPRSSLLLTIAVDTQLLVGLALYFVSPIAATARANMALAMRTRELRYWAVEHLTMMLFAVLALHGGRVFARKAEEDAAKHKRLLGVLALFVLFVLAGVPWPWMPVARPLFRLG